MGEPRLGRRRKQREEGRQHQGTWTGGQHRGRSWRGKGKGAEEWGRAQQLSLRGDRCFLIGVFGALSHPGDLLAPRVAPAILLEAATNPHNDSNNCDVSFA